MEIVPRFEFRVWGEDLSDVHRCLRNLGALRERRHSSETYVVSSVEETNVKVRAGVLDVKRRLAVRDGLEQWMPVFKTSFPVEAALIRVPVFGTLGVEPLPDSSGSLDEETFLASAREVPGLDVVAVEKERDLFSIGGCRAEAGVVRIEGVTMRTVAVESADPDAVLAVLDRLGLHGLPNESYPALIRRLRWG